MTTENEKKIYIQFHEPVGYKYFKASFGLMGLVVTPILIGIVAGSSAMQWMGFVMSIIIILAIATKLAKRTTFATVAEARAYLDEVEKEWDNGDN